MATNDICLFFDHDDGQDWCTYWTKIMGSSELKLTITQCDTLISAPNFKSRVKNSKILAILMTSNMLQFMQENDDYFIQLAAGTRVANILCYTEKEEMDEFSGLISKFSQWETYDASEEGARNRSTVGDIIGMLEKPKQKRRPTKMRKFKIVPAEIRQPGETIAIIFKDEMVQKIEVSLGTQKTKHTARRMNPYTYSLRVPNSWPVSGKSKIRLFANEISIGEHQLTFSMPTLASYQCPEFLAQLLRIEPGNREALDNALVDQFEKSMPSDGSLNNILGDLYNESSGSSDHELPTLLHFAARNGFNNFCSLLLDMPGSLAAYEVENSDGRDPADLAEKYGHTELAEFLRTFVDIEATVHACDDLYMEMSGKSLYSNQQTIISKDVPEENPYSNTSLLNQDLTKEKSLNRRKSAPAPSRPPIPVPRTLPGKTPEEFMGMKGHPGKSATLPYKASTSSAESEIIDIQKAVKEGEFTLSEAERLYESWKSRNASNSKSIRERQEALEHLRTEYISVFDIVHQKKGQKSIFKKIKGKLVKKKSSTNMEITSPSQTDRTFFRPNRHSSSSSGSRTSGSSQASSIGLPQPESESDDLLDEEDEEETSPEASPPQLRRPVPSQLNQGNRVSMKMQFLETSRSLDEEDLPPSLPPRPDRRPKLPERGYR